MVRTSTDAGYFRQVKVIFSSSSTLHVVPVDIELEIEFENFASFRYPVGPKQNKQYAVAVLANNGTELLHDGSNCVWKRPAWWSQVSLSDLDRGDTASQPSVQAFQ